MQFHEINKVVQCLHMFKIPPGNRYQKLEPKVNMQELFLCCCFDVIMWHSDQFLAVLADKVLCGLSLI